MLETVYRTSSCTVGSIDEELFCNIVAGNEGLRSTVSLRISYKVAFTDDFIDRRHTFISIHINIILHLFTYMS